MDPGSKRAKRKPVRPGAIPAMWVVNSNAHHPAISGLQDIATGATPAPFKDDETWLDPAQQLTLLLQYPALDIIDPKAPFPPIQLRNPQIDLPKPPTTAHDAKTRRVQVVVHAHKAETLAQYFRLVDETSPTSLTISVDLEPEDDAAPLPPNEEKGAWVLARVIRGLSAKHTPYIYFDARSSYRPEILYPAVANWIASPAAHGLRHLFLPVASAHALHSTAIAKQLDQILLAALEKNTSIEVLCMHSGAKDRPVHECAECFGERLAWHTAPPTERDWNGKQGILSRNGDLRRLVEKRTMFRFTTLLQMIQKDEDAGTLAGSEDAACGSPAVRRVSAVVTSSDPATPRPVTPSSATSCAATPCPATPCPATPTRFTPNPATPCPATPTPHPATPNNPASSDDDDDDSTPRPVRAGTPIPDTRFVPQRRAPPVPATRPFSMTRPDTPLFNSPAFHRLGLPPTPSPSVSGSDVSTIMLGAGTPPAVACLAPTPGPAEHDSDVSTIALDSSPEATNDIRSSKGSTVDKTYGSLFTQTTDCSSPIAVDFSVPRIGDEAQPVPWSETPEPEVSFSSLYIDGDEIRNSKGEAIQLSEYRRPSTGPIVEAAAIGSSPPASSFDSFASLVSPAPVITVQPARVHRQPKTNVYVYTVTVPNPPNPGAEINPIVDDDSIADHAAVDLDTAHSLLALAQAAEGAPRATTTPVPQGDDGPTSTVAAEGVPALIVAAEDAPASSVAAEDAPATNDTNRTTALSPTPAPITFYTEGQEILADDPDVSGTHTANDSAFNSIPPSINGALDDAMHHFRASISVSALNAEHQVPAPVAAAAADEQPAPVSDRASSIAPSTCTLPADPYLSEAQSLRVHALAASDTASQFLISDCAESIYSEHRSNAPLFGEDPAEAEARRRFKAWLLNSGFSWDRSLNEARAIWVDGERFAIGNQPKTGLYSKAVDKVIGSMRSLKIGGWRKDE
ncbi:hypothetical protein Q8F55_008664 [Vanrija albida]|uniref:Uncharacterized protein n=1 Tax=Vanrija albida TaxID=181172 RepID=A0ABR3PRH5_9TREE